MSIWPGRDPCGAYFLARFLAAAGDTAGALTSLGRAFVGGLSMGTLLTLVVVPVAYTLVDDLQHWCSDFLCNIAPSVGNSSRKEL